MSRVLALTTPPSLARLYAKALRRTRSRRSPSLPALELELSAVSVDRDHLAAYDRVCGFRVSDRLPPTYPHVIAFPLQIRLMTDETFPFPLAGLVHVRNVITQRRTLEAGTRLRLRVRARRLAANPKGAQVDLVCEAYPAEVDTDADPFWSSCSTYLARGAQVADGTTADPVASPAVDVSQLPTGSSATWRVAKDTGRQYARVSGDINPIHLHPLGARLFGFPGPIAHGMWTKARCLAALDSRLPDAMTVDVAFLQPLSLPSTARFAARATPGSAGGWTFGVLPVGEGRPHVMGTVGPAGPS